MTRLRRGASIGLLGVFAALFVGLLAAPAGSAVLQGNCTGGAVFSNGASVTERQPINDVVLVPASDTVLYTGDTQLSPPPEDMPDSFTGGVSIALPFGSVTIVNWEGTTEETSVDMGSYFYDVSGLAPEGTGGVEVTATHTQRGETCVVVVTMALDGDPGWQAWTAAGLTVLAGVGVAGAGVKRSVK